MSKIKNPKLIVAIHFDKLATDTETIQDIVEKLQLHFNDITDVDLLSENDYQSDVYTVGAGYG